MSCLNTYEHPLPETYESNDSRTLRFALPVRAACPPLPARRCQDLHNGRRCPADLPYFQPVWAPEDLSCDDSRLVFRFRIEETRAAYGAFGFFNLECGIDWRADFDGEGKTPAQLAAAYADWLTAQNIDGLSVEADGAEIEIRFPAALSGCGCDAPLTAADGAAFGQTLQQVRCCAAVLDEESCNRPTEWAEFVFQLHDDPSYVFGNPAQDIAFWPTFEGDSCARYGWDFMDPNMRMSHALSFRDYLFKAHHHLQRMIAAAWGKSRVLLDPDTGTFRLLLDRAYFEADGLQVCDLNMKLCAISTGAAALQYSILQQTACCDGPPAPCSDPEGFVSFEFEIHDEPSYVYGNPAYDAVFNLDLSNSTCPGSYTLSHVWFRLSAASNFEQYVSQCHARLSLFFSSWGASSIERVPGTGRMVVYLDREFISQHLGFDPCARRWMICQYSSVDGTSTPPPRLFIEMLRQPRCCPPPLYCDESEAERLPPPDRIDLDLHLPDRRNAPGAMHWGWRLNDADDDETWLARVELLDACCQPVAHPAERFVTGAWVGLDERGRGRQRLRVDPSRVPLDCFSLRVVLNDPCGELEFYTEPWRKTACGPTLKIEAEGRAGRICNEAAEDAPPPHLLGGWFAADRALRIPAALEWVGVEREEEEANGRVVAVRRFEVWRLRSGLLPLYVVERLEALLTAERWWIEGRAFAPPSGLSKTRQRGRMWQLDVELRREVE